MYTYIMYIVHLYIHVHIELDFILSLAKQIKKEKERKKESVNRRSSISSCGTRRTDPEVLDASVDQPDSFSGGGGGRQ